MAAKKGGLIFNLNVLIIGAGEVGKNIASTLSSESYNVYLIEQNEDNAKHADEELDARVIVGNGAKPQVLNQVFSEAAENDNGEIDIMIACTNKDEVNMLACWIAKEAGIKHIISRARNLEFTDSPDWAKKFGIELMISPERSLSREILGLLTVSSAIHTAELLNGLAALYAFKVEENSPFINKSLRDIRLLFPDLIAVFVFVQRENNNFVPNGLSVIQQNDICYVVTFRESAFALEELFNPEIKKIRSLKKIFIVGGGKLGSQIAQAIKRDFGRVQLRLIEIDPLKCIKLSQELGEALVLNGDGADKRLLLEEGINQADGYVCATDSDELNLIYSGLAKTMGVKKSIAVVRQKSYQDLTQFLPITIVDPNEALASSILRVVHYSGNLLARALSIIKTIDAEMLELEIPKDSALIGKSIAELKIPKGVLIALMQRNDKVLLPTGFTVLMSGDLIILFAPSDLMPQAAEFFNNKNEI